mmetsp:Transcript_36773/g.36399  ORF Transcript_36773/g.36399 Transcript_36773/m.36399 type:complete len:204 (+) Transcript_36773:275-886(+)
MCLEEWGLNHNRCPNGCFKFNYTRPAKVLGVQLNKLRIKCENKDNGCHKVLRYDEIQRHQQECEFSLVHCKNEGCQVSVLRPAIGEHENYCEFEKKICEGCHEVVKKSEQAIHNCFKNINHRMVNLEQMVKDTMSKLENPAEGSDNDKSKAPMCVRHEYIQDYSLEFSIYHHPQNHYQITLPKDNLPMSEDARSLILRVVVND